MQQLRHLWVLLNLLSEKGAPHLNRRAGGSTACQISESSYSLYSKFPAYGDFLPANFLPFINLTHNKPVDSHPLMQYISHKR